MRGLNTDHNWLKVSCRDFNIFMQFSVKLNSEDNNPTFSLKQMPHSKMINNTKWKHCVWTELKTFVDQYNRKASPHKRLNSFLWCSRNPPGLPAEEQLGMVLALQVAFNKIWEQVFEDVGGILQPSLQSGHDERGHVAAVTHGEGALQLQRADECQQENLVIHQLSKLLQGFLHICLPAPRHLHASWSFAHIKTYTLIR